jgi:hypothetical protein
VQKVRPPTYPNLFPLPKNLVSTSRECNYPKEEAENILGKSHATQKIISNEKTQSVVGKVEIYISTNQNSYPVAKTIDYENPLQNSIATKKVEARVEGSNKDCDVAKVQTPEDGSKTFETVNISNSAKTDSFHTFENVSCDKSQSPARKGYLRDTTKLSQLFNTKLYDQSKFETNLLLQSQIMSKFTLDPSFECNYKRSVS